MNQFKKEFLIGIAFIILFFSIETFSKSELILTILVIFFGIIFALLPSQRSVKIKLLIIGIFLGTLIEVVMGFWGRSQFWSYGSLFGVPFWLPFIWGFGFEVIYMVGKFIEKN